MIAIHLKEIRLSKALSMRELSKRSGVSPATMVRAEKGLPVYPTTVRKLAKALGVAPTELGLAVPTEPPPPPPAPPPPPRRLPTNNEPPGLQPLLDAAERCRLAGDLAGAARWERHAEELLAEGD